MKLRCALYAAGILFMLAAGCGRSQPEQPETSAPPAPTPQPVVSSNGGYEVIPVADGGAIAGTIVISGPIPKLMRRELNKDPNVCGTGSRESQQLMVNKAGGLKNAIVIVEGVKRGKAFRGESKDQQIDQNKCEYLPHVQVVTVNTELAVVNSDPILHNIHFYQNDDSLFNIAQPVKGQVTKHKLEKVGFVYAECDVHSWMRGHVAVVDNPYYAVTDEEGKFSITDLAPGMYKVKIWHEYLGEQSRDITVVGKAETALNLDLKDQLARKNPAAITSVPAVPAAGAVSKALADGGSKGNAPGAEVIVQMHSEGGTFRFEPPNITVKVGTTVKWINMSDNRHSATDDVMFEKAPGQAVLPSGVEPWSSPFLTEGESFGRKFTVPGKYQYFCRNHGQFGMVATITVEP